MVMSLLEIQKQEGIRMKEQRRQLILGLAGSVLLMGCTRSPQSKEEQWQKQFALQDEQRAKAGLPPLSDAQKALRYKFRGLSGGELVVDGFGEKEGVNIFDENEQMVFKRASVSPRNRSNSSYGSGFGVPITLRAEWRKDGPEVNGVIQNYIQPDMTKRDERYKGGIIVGSFTTTVAERVSDALLNELRTNGGGFRLKIRLHDEGILVGWDIARRPGFDQKRSDNGVHFPEEYSMVEGDFHPAKIINGEVITPGWYIHPRTKERIETDF
jgi:hypothetical protein